MLAVLTSLLFSIPGLDWERPTQHVEAFSGCMAVTRGEWAASWFKKSNFVLIWCSSHFMGVSLRIKWFRLGSSKFTIVWGSPKDTLMILPMFWGIKCTKCSFHNLILSSSANLSRTRRREMLSPWMSTWGPIMICCPIADSRTRSSRYATCSPVQGTQVHRFVPHSYGCSWTSTQ